MVYPSKPLGDFLFGFSGPGERVSGWPGMRDMWGEGDRKTGIKLHFVVPGNTPHP